jgi:hypothetical protein
MLGLDPRSTPEEITLRMRELAEEAAGPERARLQGLWRQLTLNPEQRLSTAFFAHPHPIRGLPRLQELDAESLTRRFRLSSGPSQIPESLMEGARPATAEFVILPPLRSRLGIPGGKAGEDDDWPDVDPLEDVLLML